MVVVGVLFLVVVLQVVVFFVGSAPAGRGGEGSVRAEVGDGGGGPWRCGGGWKFGGSGKTALWPCSFSVVRFCCSRRMASAVFYKVVAPSSRRTAVRRRRQSLGIWGEAVVGLIVVSPGSSGCSVQVLGSSL